ncbi:MAG: hypothetical protein M1826_005042, partial [Phylliscum demangeonii]
AASASHGVPRPNGKIAVVTGINGYVASVLGHDLLFKGYKIRGTVRSLACSQALADGAYRPFGAQFKLVQVPDVLAPRAFDDAVKGERRAADGERGIHHVASPANPNLTTVEAVVHVAVQGTKNVLQAVRNAAGAQLEALVVTSSITAIMNGSRTPPTPDQLYYASKVAAEQAVWRWREALHTRSSRKTCEP